VAKVIRNTGSFQVRDGKLLLYRVGPANGQRQRHNARARNLVTGQKDPERAPSEVRRTPSSHGYWAFPFPFQDAFFYFHVYKQQLPKRLRDKDDGGPERTSWTDENSADYEAAIKEIKDRTHPKLIWYGGPFYSHVKPKHLTVEQNWYRYDNAREWIEAARGDLWTWVNSGSLFRAHYAKDHLEIFVPE
jgi:hypothetical protein